MADRSAIEWTHSTFNPWVGCTKVSPACENCYAEISTPSRTRGVVWGAGKPRQRTSAGNWKRPLRWNAEPFYTCGCGYSGTFHVMTTNAVHGCGLKFRRVRRRVFCASLADVFDNEVPAQWRADLFALIHATPNLDWLLLTKRIGNAAAMMNAAAGAVMDDFCGAPTWERSPWPNVWLGATICNQAEADRDVPKLLRVPAAVRFLSIEPMLGKIDIRSHVAPPDLPFLEKGTPLCRDLPSGVGCTRTGPHYPREFGCRWSEIDTGGSLPGIDWVIVGGESGPHARPMHPDWARSLRDQCATAGVPFLFKQWGEWAPGSGVEFMANGGKRADLYVAEFGEMVRIGKKAAGRLLDGVTHDGYPEVRRADP